MYVGKTLFSQIMEFVPWTSFGRIVDRYGGNANKLYAMGLRHSIHRSTLGDANEACDWRIWANVAAILIRRARKLYSDTDLVGLELKNTVYVMDRVTWTSLGSMRCIERVDFSSRGPKST